MVQILQQKILGKLVFLLFIGYQMASAQNGFLKFNIPVEDKQPVKVYTYYYYPEYQAYYQEETGLWLSRRSKNVPWSVSHRAPQKQPLNWSKTNMPVKVCYQGPDPFANCLKIKQDTFHDKAPVKGIAPVKVKTSWSSHTKNGTGVKVKSVYRIKH